MALDRRLTPFGDYFVHQMGEPLVAVHDNDPRWIDRGKFWVYDEEATFCLMMGMGSYANVRISREVLTTPCPGDTMPPTSYTTIRSEARVRLPSLPTPCCEQ